MSIRTYPYDKVASHIVGYVQNVNAEDLKKHKNEGYTSNSIIGRSGIEAVYEKQLRGSSSGKIDLVNKNDKVIENLCAIEIDEGPQDITLTIDIDLQQSLYNEYQNDKSASVALNPQTGEVLALVSTPSYSNNDFVLGLSTDKWNALNNDSIKKYSKEQLLSNLKKSSKDKGTLVILMHDTGDVNNTYDVLEDSINYIKSQGYEFRTFYDILN